MSAEKYQLKLSNFDGPLDLLLHLISRAKIEVKDIFVSEITEQYLAYLQQSDMQDLESASEFLEMAATLLYIKSRALLPKIKTETEEELSEEDKMTVARARKIQKFLSQPFSVAETFTGVPGKYVPLKETVRGFKAIIDGEMDEYPENAFFNVGTIEDVIAKAKAEGVA